MNVAWLVVRAGLDGYPCQWGLRLPFLSRWGLESVGGGQLAEGRAWKEVHSRGCCLQTPGGGIEMSGMG